jgi:hypothetical protein
MINGVSLFNAQDISKNYLQENEMIDGFSQGSITCDGNNYFVIPIISGSNDISFFVIVNEKNGLVYSEKDETLAINLLKSEYILRTLYYSNKTNYLSPQLFDRMDRLISVLDSKKSKLEGLISSDYPYNVKAEITTSKNKLVTFNTSLKSLKTNLKEMYDIQNGFVYLPDCSKLSSLTSKFSSSFVGYSDISNLSFDYLDATDNTTKIVVSSTELSDDEKRSILNFIAIPNNLNSEITFIYDSLSSTNQFYSDIVTTIENTTNNKGLMLYYNNFLSRQDYVITNSLLYDFDSDFPKYDNLDTVLKIIVAPENKIYWKAQEDVESITSEYTVIKELYSKGQYKDAINKIKSIRTKAKNVLSEGYIEYQEETSKLYYWFAGGIILVIIIIIIVRKGRAKNNDKSKKDKDYFRGSDDDSFFG